MTYKYAFEILVLRYQISNIFGGRGAYLRVDISYQSWISLIIWIINNNVIYTIYMRISVFILDVVIRTGLQRAEQFTIILHLSQYVPEPGSAPMIFGMLIICCILVVLLWRSPSLYTVTKKHLLSLVHKLNFEHLDNAPWIV